MKLSNVVFKLDFFDSCVVLYNPIIADYYHQKRGGGKECSIP